MALVAAGQLGKEEDGGGEGRGRDGGRERG